MKISKQEMESFLLLFHLQSKTFFYKMFLTFINEFKNGFENMKWNYLKQEMELFLPLPDLQTKKLL